MRCQGYDRSLTEFVRFLWHNEYDDESYNKNLEKVTIWLYAVTKPQSSKHNLVLRMLQANPSKRPPISEVMQLTEKSHQLFKPQAECCPRDPEPYIVYNGPPPSPIEYILVSQINRSRMSMTPVSKLDPSSHTMNAARILYPIENFPHSAPSPACI